ncbi:MAG: hypothetical protein WCP35_04260 [Verrucomicrobiota bacterium]
MIAHSHLFRISSLALLAMAASLQAQVHYRENGQPWAQRAATGLDAEVPGWFDNLGITGLRAQLVTDDPKVLPIKYVFQKSSAAGQVQAEDRIIGAGGQLFKNTHIYGCWIFNVGFRNFQPDGGFSILTESGEVTLGDLEIHELEAM